MHDTPLFSLLTFDADSDCCLVRDGRAVSFFKFGIQVSFNVKRGGFTVTKTAKYYYGNFLYGFFEEMKFML